MGLYRKLNTEEEEEFRQWARDNWTPGEAISPLWHPVIRHECNKIVVDHEKMACTAAMNILIDHGLKDDSIEAIERFIDKL